MTAAQPISKTYTFDEYVALEQTEGIRYEYWDGEVMAMAGRTKRHNTIVQNIAFTLRPLTRKKGCQVCSAKAENRTALRLSRHYLHL